MDKEILEIKLKLEMLLSNHPEIKDITIYIDETNYETLEQEIATEKKVRLQLDF